MRRAGYTRRVLLRQLAFLGLGVGAAWWVREHYLFPKPRVSFASDASGTGWMALPDRAGLVELTAHVRGIPIRVVVDSGAQFSAIDRNLALRLGLVEEPIPLLAFGVSGSPSLTHTVSLDLEIGDLRLGGVRAATLQLLTLSGVVRRPFAMLIGRDVLGAVIADIDWPNGRARFLRPEGFTPPVGAEVARTTSRGGAMMTAVSIEGARAVEVMIDTGATSDLALSETAARSLGLLADRPVSVGRSVSLGGMSHDKVVHARSVEFSGRRLNDVEVQVFTPAVQGPLPDGLLGVGILRRYRATMDLGAGVLWLTPAKPTSGEPFPRLVMPQAGGG